jgi:hypothetical protein
MVEKRSCNFLLTAKELEDSCVARLLKVSKMITSEYGRSSSCGLFGLLSGGGSFCLGRLGFGGYLSENAEKEIQATVVVGSDANVTVVVGESTGLAITE